MIYDTSCLSIYEKIIEKSTKTVYATAGGDMRVSLDKKV
jgi:hypothetical protein